MINDDVEVIRAKYEEMEMVAGEWEFVIDTEGAKAVRSLLSYVKKPEPTHADLVAEVARLGKYAEQLDSIEGEIRDELPTYLEDESEFPASAYDTIGHVAIDLRDLRSEVARLKSSESHHVERTKFLRKANATLLAQNDSMRRVVEAAVNKDKRLDEMLADPSDEEKVEILDAACDELLRAVTNHIESQKGTA